MVSRNAAAIAVCLCLAASGVQAQDESVTTTLDPVSRWVLDFGDEQCSLIRSFGEGEHNVNLRIDSYGSHLRYRFMLTGDLVMEPVGRIAAIGFRFTPDTVDRLGGVLFGHSGVYPAMSFGASFEPFDPNGPGLDLPDGLENAAHPEVPQPAFEQQVETLRVPAKGGPLILRLGNMAEPLKAMRRCVDDLQASWGLDPNTQKSLRRRAVPTRSTVRRVQRRYPMDMVRQGNNAFVPVRLMIDAQGNPTACVVQSDAPDEPFKKATCEGLSRRYEPALDQAGRPVDSFFHTSVIYRL
jgi:hypothetical protein